MQSVLILLRACFSFISIYLGISNYFKIYLDLMIHHKLWALNENVPFVFCLFVFVFHNFLVLRSVKGHLRVHLHHSHAGPRHMGLRVLLCHNGESAYILMKREETKDNISIVNKNNIAIPLKGAVIMKGAIVTIKLILGNNGKLYRKVVKVYFQN